MLAVASYNLCNLGLDARPGRIERIAEHLAERLGGPALVALQEIKAPGPAGGDGRVPADAVYAALAEAITARGGPAYAWLEVPPEADSTGGVPGFNIRSGLLYDPRRLSLTGHAEITAPVALERGRLCPNPGLLAPRDPAFAGDAEAGWRPARPVLAAEFDLAGEPLVVLNVHLKSMQAESRRAGEAARKQRHAQARRIRGFVDRLLAERGAEARLLVLGDFNDTPGTKTLAIVRGEELVNLHDALPKRQRYTARHGGRPVVLDHVLASPALAAGAELHVDHLNTDAPLVRRASDHDPLLARLAT